MFKKFLLLVFVLCWISLAINPVHRGIWMMENFLVVTLFPVFIWLDKRYTFNDWTYAGMIFFGILHLFGAHLTYEKMDYFIWLSDYLGLERNYYDQFVHFLFGLLVFIPFFEIFHHQNYSRRLSYLIAFLFISSIGAWYEILEWLGMVFFCNEPDCLVLVTQGDAWDTQKDLAFAFAGAVIALLIHTQMEKIKQSKIEQVLKTVK